MTIACINCEWTYSPDVTRSKEVVDQVLMEHYQMRHAGRPDDGSPHQWDPHGEVDMAQLDFEVR